MQQIAPDIEALDAGLVAISPQLNKYNRSIVREKGPTFDVLNDPGNRVAQKFGLVYQVPEELNALYLKFGIDLVNSNGDNSLTLPLPSRYIIHQNAKIRYAEANPDYTNRPEPEDTLAALRSMGK